MDERQAGHLHHKPRQARRLHDNGWLVAICGVLALCGAQPTWAQAVSAIEVAPVQLPLNQAVGSGAAVGVPSGDETDVDEPAVVPGEILLSPAADPSVVSDEVPLEMVPDGASPMIVGPGMYLEAEDSDADSPVWLRNLSLSVGVHGFRGPSDLGSAGNFGFNESANWGFPLLRWFNISGQLGVRGVHSNFSGNTARFDAEGFHSARDQLFVTAGFFTRAVDGGWQTGSAFDYFHDSAYSGADLTQARVELAYNFGGLFEIGFWGAYGANSDTVTFSMLQRLVTHLEPTDLYALFYRHHFSGGGQGRIWGGMTGDGAAVFGAEGTFPLGTNWAIENHFTYRVADPDQPPQIGDESWAVTISLVWYPGHLARNVFRDPDHPLFNVADNAVFLIDRGPATPAP